MAAAELVSDAALFIDDVLSFVFDHLLIYRVPYITPALRNVDREDAVYKFLPEIGDALVHIIPAFIDDFTDFFSLPLPQTRLSVGNFIRRQKAAFLTDEDFFNYTYYWCSVVLNFLFNVTSLCIHFAHYRPAFVNAVKVAAIAVLDHLMISHAPWKMEKLSRYATRFPNMSDYEKVCMFLY